MRFLSEGRSEETMIHYYCGSGKYTTLLCFSIRGVNFRVPAPSRTWGVQGFSDVLSHHSAWLYFAVRLSDVKKIP